jgi:hypothetical protein
LPALPSAFCSAGTEPDAINNVTSKRALFRMVRSSIIKVI